MCCHPPKIVLQLVSEYPIELAARNDATTTFIMQMSMVRGICQCNVAALFPTEAVRPKSLIVSDSKLSQVFEGHFNHSITACCMQAYMTTDFLLFLIPFTPTDFLFIAHHLMTIVYMMSALHLNRGGLSCLILMVLGESTSLFQNSWLISRELRHEHPVS